MGGYQSKGIGDVFQGGGTGGDAIWVVDEGAEPPHGTGTRKLPTWGWKVYNRDTAKEKRGGGLIIPTNGGSNGRGRIRGVRGLYLKETEHGRKLHCDAADYGPLKEDSADARGLVCSEMVRKGRDRPSGYEGAGGGDSRRGR